MIRRASTLEVQLEAMEGQLSEGESVKLTEYAIAASHLRRILDTLGITRTPRDVTPTLSDYLREHYDANGSDNQEAAQ